MDGLTDVVATARIDGLEAGVGIGVGHHPDTGCGCGGDCGSELAAVPVKFGGEVPVSQRAADYGAYTTLAFVGTEAPQSLLPHDPARKVAYIACSGAGPVWLGSAAQCSQVFNGNTKGGGYELVTGATLTVTHRQSVSIVPAGTTATVSVAIERWSI